MAGTGIGREVGGCSTLTGGLVGITTGMEVGGLVVTADAVAFVETAGSVISGEILTRKPNAITITVAMAVEIIFLRIKELVFGVEWVFGTRKS